MNTISQVDQESSSIVALSLLCLPHSARLQVADRVRDEGSFAGVEGALNGRQRDIGRMVYEQCRERGIEVFTILDRRYPHLLRQADGAPLVLFARGNRPGAVLSDAALGVVGTRAATVGVCQRASRIASDLALAGFTVVSGLALGIDGAAHRGALEAGIECPTVAVLAHGLDRIYPSSHQGLATQIIAAGGLLVSEYPPGTEPLKHHFLARNRIIAGLSRGVVIVQAGARSGSLVTAQFAADFGRDVFIVSADGDDERSSGGELMIEQGAIRVASARDVLAEYGIEGSEKAREELWFDSTLADCGLSHVEFLAKELRGEVIRLQGNRVRFLTAHTKLKE